jgi:hypothetical protein
MSDSENYGIIGNVNAKAVAVGTGARATVNESGDEKDRETLEAAIKELTAQLAALPLAPAAHDLLRGDIDKLKQLPPGAAESRPQASGILERLTEKLKMVNIAVEAAAPLAGPIKTIAALFGIPHPF